MNALILVEYCLLIAVKFISFNTARAALLLLEEVAQHIHIIIEGIVGRHVGAISTVCARIHVIEVVCTLQIEPVL